MKSFQISIALLLAVFASSCSQRSTVSTYWVNSMRVECDNASAEECLLVQEGDTIDPNGWSQLRDRIEGFEFEMGFLYQIKVKEQGLHPDEIGADGACITYSLVEVLKKEPDAKLRLHDIWVVTTINGDDVSASSQSLQKDMVLEIFIKDMRVVGTDGCNNFMGGIASVGQQELKLGPLAGTRMMCQDMTLPDQFMRSLSAVTNYEIIERNLHLYGTDDTELLVLKKVD